MNDTPRNIRPSLLERAAEVYDFQAHLRARAASQGSAVYPPNHRSPHGRAEAVPPVARPDARAAASAYAHVAQQPPAAFHAPNPEPAGTSVPPAASPQLRIDRRALASAGLLVPGASINTLAEEFRLVKRQLLATARSIAAEDALLARTMLVCSANPNEGKTYCVVNLAISMAAERDTEVLLIDADFPKPDVLRRLGLGDASVNAPGLLDALASPHADAERLVLRTDIPQLSILPAGRRSNQDTELLASERTRAVVEALLAADPRRILIFDSPPALAASPAGVLAGLVGQVMLVVRADRTSDTDLREAVSLLDGCETIQLLINAVSFAPQGRRFGSYYGQAQKGLPAHDQGAA